MRQFLRERAFPLHHHLHHEFFYHRLSWEALIVIYELSRLQGFGAGKVNNFYLT